MQQDCTISLERNAMSEGGIRWMYFDAFSSKSSDRNILINTYEQGCSIAFWCRSFTGKERDEETGFGYFGARYMDHELMTMWLSVDPMADKYPGISPYNYCAWNPIILVDPDGRDTSYYNLDGRQQFVKKGGSDINMMIVTRKNVDEESFDKGGYYAFDVNEIDFEKMDNMYKSSEVKGADEWYYRVRKDGTSTELEKLGPHGGKVQFAEDDKFNVHTHTLDNAMENQSL